MSSIETAIAGVRIEALLPEGAGAWVDVSTDVISGVKAEWGIRGDSIKDRVADPGTLTFDLDNSDQNSGGVRGYYSPDCVDVRGGFARGLEVRLVLSHPLYGDRVKWRGTVASIKPQPGVDNPRTSVSCVDWMEEAARTRPSLLPVLVDTQANFVMTQLLSAITKAPPATRIPVGSDIYPYALDNFQDESGAVLGEFQKVAMSEFGYIYVDAGTLIFESRKTRAILSPPKFALDETFLQALEITNERDDIVNRIQVSVHPRLRDPAATTVLFTLGAPQSVLQKTSIVINCPYRDPTQKAQRVAGIDMVPPVLNTDYQFNSLADGTGTDLSTQLSGTITFGGNAADVNLTNNGPQDGFLILLQLRGRGLYDYEPVISEAKDAASANEFGENISGFNMPYQSSPAIGSDTASFILGLGKDPATRVTSATFMGNWSDDVLLQLFDRTISDRISVDAPKVGVSTKQFFINGISLDISLAGAIKCTYALGPADTTQYWTLGVAGATELDQTTVLGYGLFVVGWILETDALDATTFLN